MIAFRCVLVWLNQFDKSYLGESVRDLVEQLNQPELSSRDLDSLLSRILSSTQNRHIWREHAEALLNCAAAKYERERLNDTLRLLSGAIKLYTLHKDYHRLAVTRWLQGLVRRQLGDTHPGFVSWNLAREIFQALVERYVLLEKQDQRDWYQERVEEMHVDLVCTLEQGYTWLDRFEPSHLSLPLQKMNDQLQEKVKHKDVHEAMQISQDMQIIARTGSDPLEEAEVWVECALASCLLGNQAEGLKLLKMAFSSFPPYGHHQAVMRWMIGILQWDVPSEHPNAIRNWQSCQQIMIHLASDADHKNLQERKTWYEAKQLIMGKALQMKIEEMA